MHSRISVAAATLLALAAEAAEPPTPPGGVEVTEVSERRFRTGPAGSPGVGELKLSLFFAVPAGPSVAGKKFYFDKVAIDPVYDATGRRLSPDEFAEYVEGLGRHHGVVTADHQGEGKDARSGPSLEFYLDLPARNAATIKRLKGSAEVTAGSEEELTIRDVAGAAGKAIDSPALVGLSVTPVVRKEKGKTVVALRVTGNAERLLSWYPTNEGVNFSTAAEPTRPIEGGVELGEEVYHVEDSKIDVLPGMELRLKVFVPAASYRFAFDLKDVELP